MQRRLQRRARLNEKLKLVKSCNKLAQANVCRLGVPERGSRKNMYNACFCASTCHSNLVKSIVHKPLKGSDAKLTEIFPKVGPRTDCVLKSHVQSSRSHKGFTAVAYYRSTLDSSSSKTVKFRCKTTVSKVM